MPDNQGFVVNDSQPPVKAERRWVWWGFILGAVGGAVVGFVWMEVVGSPKPIPGPPPESGAGGLAGAIIGTTVGLTCRYFAARKRRSTQS